MKTKFCGYGKQAGNGKRPVEALTSVKSERRIMRAYDRKRIKTRVIRKMSRIHTKNKDCRSRKDRLKRENNPIKYGHWEDDNVGKRSKIVTL